MNHSICTRRILGIIGVAMLIVLAATGCAARGKSPAFALHTIQADDAALRMATEAGATAIVQLFEWRTIELQPEEYHWEYPDFVLRACEYYGMDLIMRLDHPPDWAIQARSDPSLPVDLDAFDAFLQRVAERYRGRVSAYIIWNEPNLAREWNGQPPDPEGYARILTSASRAIRAGDPAATVVCAGLAPTNQNDAEAMDDIQYLTQMLQAVKGESFDALAAHPYGFGLAPEAPADANQGLNARRITRLYQILSDAGFGETPIWITEMGWTTGGQSDDVAYSVTDNEQADYLLRSFDLAGSEWPWVELLTVWNLTTGLVPEDEKAGYSIVANDFSPLPAYTALAERFSQRSLLEHFMDWRQTTARPSTPIQILSPDVVVRLGDMGTFYPHWTRIYDGTAPTREWAGIFYVDNPGRNDWQLSMEIMQVEEPGNLVSINGQSVSPPGIPLRGRPDYSSVWTGVTMEIPAAFLYPGPNRIEVKVSPRLPALQFVRYESMQFRNVTLTPQ